MTADQPVSAGERPRRSPKAPALATDGRLANQGPARSHPTSPSPTVSPAPAPVQAAAELAAEAGASDRRRRTALVVDDEPLIGHLISALLARNGWQTIVTLDGETAVSLMDGRVFDLLVTDYELSGMSGLALVERVRERLPELPILVVSGRPGAHRLVHGRRVAFVAKPFLPDELIETVRALAS